MKNWLLESVCNADLIMLCFVFLLGFIFDLVIYNDIFKRLKHLSEVVMLNNSVFCAHKIRYHEGLYLNDLLKNLSSFSRVCIFEPIPGTVGEFRDLFVGHKWDIPKELEHRKVNTFYPDSEIVNRFCVGLEEVMDHGNGE